MVTLEHKKWVEASFDITIEAFAKRFSFTNSRSAYTAFSNAVKMSGLKDRAKAVVIERFNTWKANKSGASMFWLQQRQSMSIRKGKSVATRGLVDAAANELPRAIQASYHSITKNDEVCAGDEDCTSDLSTSQEKKRSSCYQIDSTFRKKTRDNNGIDDNEVDDNEVDDNGMEDDDEGDDETGVQADEILREEVIRELREIENNTEPGFYPLIRALYHAVRGEFFHKPIPKPILSMQQSFLWDFVYSRLDIFGTMASSEQKDVFVAVSGIVDLELHASFPEHDKLIQRCRAGIKFTYPAIREQIKTYQQFVDVQDGIEEAKLDDLRRQLRKDIAQFNEGSTEMIVAEILMILVKRCVPDKFGRAKRTESSSLFVWYAVWEVLFSSTAVEVEVGETTLKEAQKDQVAIRVAVGSKTPVGRAGTSGRKLDFRLVASLKTGQRFEPFTLSNDEHKGLGSSDLTADTQRKKNMRLNKSIISNGKVPMITGNIYQDVVGLEGTWNIMCPFEDVMLCCKTEEPPLRLPSNEFELGGFLHEDGMERLLAYRVSMHMQFPCYQAVF
ncbi:hypothetical protein BGX21_004150 [Mortierella sp. AD011]|nr:hypothetical protein BGX21_004150 [Mortierella sp. AD011]